MQGIRKRFVSIIRGLVLPPRQAKTTTNTTCVICLDDDINANQMFSVKKCRHRFCYACVRRYIEVSLLQGSVVRCPHFHCRSKMTLGSCSSLLTPELRTVWQEKINEDSIPISKKIYCPNPRCSALMSFKISKSTKEANVRRDCFKCGQYFCVNCKVPWHSNLSCEDYKILDPKPTQDDIKLKALANQNMWRQCTNCHHMIELSEGCVHVRCRCGHDFCYQCGAKVGSCDHHGYPPGRPPMPPLQPSPAATAAITISAATIR